MGTRKDFIFFYRISIAMKTTPTPTPTTIEDLQQQNEKLEKQVTELSTKLAWFQEQFRLSQQRRFGASSEKTGADQL